MTGDDLWSGWADPAAGRRRREAWGRVRLAGWLALAAWLLALWPG